ncbi:MAG: alpha/beta fold hydrolase [Armatimonadota bacterium]
MGGILLAAALAGAFVWFLYAFQETLIYHPLPSRIAVRDELPAGVEALQYTIEGPRRERLRQESYLALPTGSAGSKGIRVAVLFHGNASSALDWPEAAGYLRERGFHLLMVEYPGYGRCEGEPSPKSIELASREAFRTLAERLEVPERELERRTVAIGHSLGSAAALLFASDRELRQVILLAPFTSSMDLARRRVGWPLCLLLQHRYDNRSLLAKIVDRQRPAEVLIVHGARDDIIPPGMSRRLAAISPAISRVELPEADHVTVVDASREAIVHALSAAE